MTYEKRVVVASLPLLKLFWAKTFQEEQTLK